MSHGDQTDIADVDDFCIVPECKARRAAGENFRGLCMRCYSTAKKEVAAGRVTWKQLVEIDLALPVGNAFTKALEERSKQCPPQ
jgi:hypothetical protein